MLQATSAAWPPAIAAAYLGRINSSAPVVHYTRRRKAGHLKSTHATACDGPVSAGVCVLPEEGSVARSTPQSRGIHLASEARGADRHMPYNSAAHPCWVAPPSCLLRRRRR